MFDISIPGRPCLENVRKLDLLPMPMLARMHRLGIAIDIPYLQSLSADLGREMADLRLDITSEIPEENLDLFINRSSGIEEGLVNVNSGEQMADLLFECLKVGKGRELKLTKTGTRISTGKKQLETLKREHPVIKLVLDYRERSKLKNTYADGLPVWAKLHPRGECPICGLKHVESTQRVHTEFTTTRTDTGRIASKQPGLQNIPARTELGRRVRAGFVASPGTRLVSRDFAQIELRLLAHCANESNMLDIFKRNGDIHTETAMRAFGIVDPKQVDKLLHRAPCKNINFAVCYGMSKSGLLDQMAVTYATAGLGLPDWLTEEWCDQFIKDWFKLYPGVRDYMDIQVYRARRYGLVWDLFGRVRWVPEVESCHSWIRSAGLRQAGNLPIQATAAGLMKLAMGKVEPRLLETLDAGIWCWPLLTIHDELLLEVNEEWADSVGEMVGMEMDNCMDGVGQLRVPILSDGKSMERWVKE